LLRPGNSYLSSYLSAARLPVIQNHVSETIQHIVSQGARGARRSPLGAARRAPGRKGPAGRRSLRRGV